MLSVVVSTYNKPHHLRLVLESLLHQNHPGLEVIVADDGSTDDTRDLVQAFAARAPFRVEHVWQPDAGFRAARVRNLGVLAATGERILFLDGDCVPFPNCTAVHATASPQHVLAGDRLYLDKEPTAELSVAEVASGGFRDRLPATQMVELRRRVRKDRFYRWTRLKKRPKIVTANVSLSRQALDDVNGLDERFVGWGHEDEDLRRRLVARGYQIRSVFTTALVCHLWHPHVDSFHGKVKYGDNVPYYQRGFFLSRCREGLTPRPLDDCSIRWNNNAPEANAEIANTEIANTEIAIVEIAIVWGPQARRSPSEILIEVLPGTATPRVRADLRIRTERPDGDGSLIAGAVPEIHIPEDPDLATRAGRTRLLERLAPIL